MLDWLACVFVRVVSGLLCRIPPSVTVWLGARLGSLAYWLQPTRTRIGLRNLRAAFDGTLDPAACRRVITSCYQQLGSGMLELLRLPVMDRAYVDRYITFEGRHHFDAAIHSGKPVIFLTGHYGNWELSSIVAALIGSPIVALARTQDHFPRLYRLLVSYRESKGCTIVHKGGAMKRLIAALARGQLVGIVGDQASRQGIFVDFFGRPAPFATGPFELARSKQALILPAFIHRIRGPCHRIVIEPPITLSQHARPEEAVREGIERFAELLARHIREEPSQWLWMHKRWKHTPARRVLVLSDGKTGHVKQSLAVVDALRLHHPQLRHEVVEVRYRHGAARLLALLWAWWLPPGLGASRCLQWTLSPASGSALLGRFADLIVSCGSSAAPINILWSRENGARSIVIMNPTPLPLKRFSLVLAPRHDALPRRPNVIRTVGALVGAFQDGALQEATHRLASHPKFRAHAAAGHSSRSDKERAPIVSVFLGGDTLHYALTTAFADALIEQVKAACERINGWCLVTTSRRTALAVERLLAERLERYPRCRLLLIATRDPIDGTMDGMLGSADVAVVTGESTSMVSEACASGRRVVVVEPPLRRSRAGLTKHQRFIQELVREGYARIVPIPELGLAIQRAWEESRPAKRLDDFATVRDAVSKLL